MIARIRAQLNREFAITLHDRETANADHFDRLGLESRAMPRLGGTK
jgi:hypothetical protein